jgi:hypothetical protein
MRPQSPNADYWVMGLPVEFPIARRFHLGSVPSQRIELLRKQKGPFEICPQPHVLIERFATLSALAVVCFPPLASQMVSRRFLLVGDTTLGGVGAEASPKPFDAIVLTLFRARVCLHPNDIGPSTCAVLTFGW